MAIADSPRFASDQDLHILRTETGLSLGDLLTVSWLEGTNTKSDTLTQYLQLSRNDFTIEFRPVRRFVQADGINIDKFSGAILMATGPTVQPLNFVVHAEVTQNPGGPPNVPAAALRIHVHQRVEKVWLTPNRLTI